MNTLREQLIAMNLWTQDDELRHQVSAIKQNRDWKAAQRKLLKDAGVPDSEIEPRIERLEHENA